MRKKIGLLACLTTIAIMSTGITTIASTPIGVLVNSKAISFDVEPNMVDDRVLVPVRGVFEALGCEVGWDNENRKVIIVQKKEVDGVEVESVISLFIDKPELYKDDVVMAEMDVPAKIYEDRTFVPVRAISEMLDADVDWDNDNRNVIIITPEYKAAIENADKEDFYKILVRQGELVLMEAVCNVTNGYFFSDELNEIIKEKLRGYSKEWITDNQVLSQESYKESPEKFETFTFTGDFAPTQDDRGYLSMVFTGVSKHNGQENTMTKSVTFDNTTYEEKTIKDIIPDLTDEEWEDFYIKSFMGIVNQASSYFYGNTEELLRSNLDNIGFYLTPDEVVFYMPRGIIGKDTLGDISFGVPFSYKPLEH